MAWKHIWGFTLVLVASQQALAQPLTDINYALMISAGGGYDSSGCVPAIELAEEMIRANGTILADYNLTHTASLDTQCDGITSRNQFFQSVPSSDPPVLALLGSGCSVATEPVAQIIHHWNISQISYASSSIALSDRVQFPNFFRTYPSDASFIPAIRSVIEFYGWKRIMFFTQDENIFTETFTSLRRQLRPLNITADNRPLPPTQDTIRLPSDLFENREEHRVFFINTYSDVARVIICEAAMLGLTYPRYAWLTYGWYQDRWWTEAINPNSMVDCTDQQLTTFLYRALALQIVPTPENTSAPTDTGLSEEEFFPIYTERVENSPYDYTFVATIAYDATWALAIALDRTSKMVGQPTPMIASMTNCSAAGPGSGLVPLEDFTYANSFMGCVIQSNLAQTDFMGVSGRVRFNRMGTRIQAGVIALQFRATNESGSIKRVKFGFIDTTLDELSYVNNESDLTVYPDGTPPDGTPSNNTVTYHLALVITYDIIAFFGLIFTTVCLVFNFAYRNRKIVRLTSPNLNYFIILGCYIIFISVYLRLIPSIDPDIVIVQCYFQTWVSSIGYTLAFATVLSKMIRVYHIFNNPTPNKQSLKDWHLVIIILSLTGFSALLLLIGSVVPQFKPDPVLRPNAEDPEGEDELGVRIDNFYWSCYNNSAGFFWFISVYVYLALLQLIGFILAVQTRKVKIKALNDSKYVAAIIYVTSIVLVVLVLVTFALSRFLTIAEVFFSGMLMLGTTAFLSLIFIPKMVSLYRDPHGEYIFDKTNPASTIEIGKSGAIAIKSKSGDNEKIHALENKIKNLENELTISQRRFTVANANEKINVPDASSQRRSTSACDVQIELHPAEPQGTTKHQESRLLPLSSNNAIATKENAGLDTLDANGSRTGSFISITEGDAEKEIAQFGSTPPFITTTFMSTQPSPSPPSQRKVNGNTFQTDL